MAARRILIVEDEVLLAMDIEASLREAGYEVVGVADRCRTAVELARRKRPDLVVMDVQLAGSRSGVEAARLIRQRYGIPCLFVAAEPARELAVHAAAVDAVGWLPKPASRDRLARAVADALR
jgi:two-component system, response regulator PdtaR